MPTKTSFFNRKFSGTIDMNFSGFLDDRKCIEITGSGLWSKRVKGSRDLREDLECQGFQEVLMIISSSLGTSLLKRNLKI